MRVTETVEVSAVVWREGKLYVALCPELDVASQGESVEEAKRDAIRLVEEGYRVSEEVLKEFYTLLGLDES